MNSVCPDNGRVGRWASRGRRGYRPPVEARIRDATVIDALNGLVAEHNRWGFWKCYDRLRLDGYRWNHKRLWRVYRALGLHLPRRSKRRVPRRLRPPLAAPPAVN